MPEHITTLWVTPVSTAFSARARRLGLQSTTLAAVLSCLALLPTCQHSSPIVSPTTAFCQNHRPPPLSHDDIRITPSESPLPSPLPIALLHCAEAPPIPESSRLFCLPFLAYTTPFRPKGRLTSPSTARPAVHLRICIAKPFVCRPAFPAPGSSSRRPSFAVVRCRSLPVHPPPPPPRPGKSYEERSPSIPPNCLPQSSSPEPSLTTREPVHRVVDTALQ